MRPPLFQGIVGLVVAVVAILAGAVGDYSLFERIVLLVLGVTCASIGASLVGEWINERWLDEVEAQIQDAAHLERLQRALRATPGTREACLHPHTRAIDPELCDGNTLRCLDCGHEFGHWSAA